MFLDAMEEFYRNFLEQINHMLTIDGNDVTVSEFYYFDSGVITEFSFSFEFHLVFRNRSTFSPWTKCTQP